MNPPIFEILNRSVQVRLQLGSNPLRVYPWDRAPQNPVYPYACYNMYNAVPENYLGKVPDIDNKGTQLIIYSKNTSKLELCYRAVRDAIEPEAHMTNFQTIDKDDDTDDYAVIMDFDFWEDR